jgi:hypothetical protein
MTAPRRISRLASRADPGDEATATSVRVVTVLSPFSLSKSSARRWTKTSRCRRGSGRRGRHWLFPSTARRSCPPIRCACHESGGPQAVRPAAGQSRASRVKRHAIAVEGELRRQDLQRDVASELGIARSIHLAHPAGPDGGKDFIRAEEGAGLECHQQILPKSAPIAMSLSAYSIGVPTENHSPSHTVAAWHENGSSR